ADETESAWLRARILTLLGRASSTTFDRDDLFAAWQTFFERAGQGSPVVLLIDDMQNADEGTMSFVEHLLANSESALFIMLMTRPGLLERWPDIATNRRATVLHLATLDSREMSALVDGLVNGLPEDVRDGLVERAQGVPLYAIETVRSLIDRDLVVPRGGVYVLPDPSAVDLSTIGAPASLHALIAARLDGLPAPERRIVADASVLGATFTREAIAVLAADVSDLENVLAALTRAEIFSTVMSRLSAEYGQYRFVQDIVRQVAYGTLSRRDRKARHLAVAAYFETLPDTGGENAPMLAQHYLDAVESSADTDADLTDLRAKTVAHLARAAARADTLGAPADALRYLELALAQQPDDATAAELHKNAAWAGQLAADGDVVKAHARAAMEYFERVGDVIAVGDCVAVLSLSMAYFDSDNAAALELAQPYWDSLQGVRGAESVLLQLARAILGARQNLNQPDVEFVLQALAIADSTADRTAFGRTLNGLGITLLAQSPTFARILFSAVVDIAREEQLPGLAGRALTNQGLLEMQDDLSKGVEVLVEGSEMMRKAGESRYQGLIDALNRALLAWERGQWDHCEELLAQIPVDSPLGTVVPWLDGALADARGRARQYPSIDDAARTIDDQGLLSYVAMADMYEARARGDLSTAVAKGIEAVELMVEVAGLLDDQIHAWPAAVESALAAGDDDALRRLIEIVDTDSFGAVGRGYRAHRARFAALLAVRDGADEDVERSFRDAIEGFDVWGSPVYAAKARAELARWLDEQARVEEAHGLRAEAVKALTAAGANGWLAQLGLVAESVPAAAT
ncbi:MAG TPA: hypothetical protein VJ831_10840, partial [Jatrophihabitantaceae bacterium]|nr:hypothetical protein [Jatrophihabitantaceae bacterium]